MGNYLSKLCFARTDDKGEFSDRLVLETTAHASPNDDKYTIELKTIKSEDQPLKYTTLRAEQKEKLEELYGYIISNAPIDFTLQEINDIQNAVQNMLERIRMRVNERGVFKIGRTLSSGSMHEKTSLWKYFEGCPYLEFDYLAVLENVLEQYENNCKACVKLVNAPVDLQRLKKYYNREDNVNAKRLVNNIFLNEINSCLSSSCDCLSFARNNYETIVKDTSELHSNVYMGGRDISFQPTSARHKPGCEHCTVYMPTGSLSVNTDIHIIEFYQSPNNCSLILLWTSNTNTLSAPDKLLLHNPSTISSMPIFVDFLPALEALKPTLSRTEYEHDFFIVPKGCNVCHVSDDSSNWRKSLCRDELYSFNIEMSDKHRRCYQIIKFLSKGTSSILSNYHLKTVVLNHHTTCSDSTDLYVNCVFAMLRDILRAYTTFELMSYRTNLNMFERTIHISTKDGCEKLLAKLYSVSETESWESFVKKIFNRGLTESSDI